MTRGEGEKQLEADRRTLLRRMHRVKSELKEVQRERTLRRKQRKSTIVGSLVGYTNAGKSSLLNALSGSKVAVADRPFATLDPTTRRVELGGGAEVALTDTVGFVRRLPEGIVDAFRATLEETTTADFLLVVVDGSDPEAEEHYRTTRETLVGIGAWEKPRIVVATKCDRSTFRSPLVGGDSKTIPASPKNGDGLIQIKQAIRDILSQRYCHIECALPQSRGDLVALARRTGLVEQEEYENHTIHLIAKVPQTTFRRLKPFETVTSPSIVVHRGNVGPFPQ